MKQFEITKKKQDLIDTLSFSFGLISILCFLLTFLVAGFIFPTFIFGFFAIVFGVIKKEHSLFSFLGIISGIVVLILVTVLILLGIFLFRKDIKGTWTLIRNSNEITSTFEIGKNGDECYWKYESDYYMGTCEYGIHSNTDESVPDADENTYVLYMDLDKIKYEDVIYPASEFLEMEHPYFLLYIYVGEDYNSATFYNPTSDITYRAKKVTD